MRIAQLLNYPLNDINVAMYKRMGFTHIQIGPIQPTKTELNEWQWLYQPTDLAIGNRLGSKEDFIALCNRAHNIGLKVSVDVIVDHMAGKDDGSLYPHEKCNPALTNKREYLLHPIAGCNPEEDRWQCVNRCYGMPRINYFSEEIVDKIEAFLTEVLAYADTIRIDMAKHIALPYEGGYLFWQMIKSLNRDTYGECINLPSNLMRDYAKYTKCLVMDHDSKINPSDMVVMMESHDTYGSKEMGYTKRYTHEERLQRYRNIVREYPNTLFFFRPFDSIDYDRIRLINLFS